MKGKIICSNSISINKKSLIFIVKFILLLIISHLIIQLSIEAKETEEKKGISGLQTTIEFANQYMKGKYRGDWEKLESRFDYPDALSSVHFLELSSDTGMLLVSSAPEDDYFIMQIDMRKGNNSIRIETYYRSSFIHVAGIDNNISYYLKYESGKYIQNPIMEQETGFTTDEIVEQAGKMRNAFEEEMEKMHKYQIVRAKERREKLTAFGFIIFSVFLLVYLFIKRISINKRADIENKYREEVLKETIAKTKEKFLKKRYLLLGCAISFWIYILIPIISEFILFPIEETVNEHAAYGISAFITAVVFGLLWKRSAIGKIGRMDAGIQMLKNVFRFVSGCVVTLIVIQLGIIFVPRFYSPEWRFYKINLCADGLAFLIFIIIVAIKKSKAGTDYDNTESDGKGDFR